MVAVLEILAANAAILVALTALSISLRANYTAHLAHKLNLQNKADIAAQEELLANIRRLTIHVERDIAHEQALLNELRSHVAASGEALPAASVDLKC